MRALNILRSIGIHISKFFYAVFKEHFFIQKYAAGTRYYLRREDKFCYTWSWNTDPKQATLFKYFGGSYQIKFRCKKRDPKVDFNLISFGDAMLLETAFYPHKSDINMDPHKNLELITIAAIEKAKLHNCNYNIILMNPNDQGLFSDQVGSTYEFVTDSYFEKPRPHAILLIQTDDLLKKESNN